MISEKNSYTIKYIQCDSFYIKYFKVEKIRRCFPVEVAGIFIGNGHHRAFWNSGNMVAVYILIGAGFHRFMQPPKLS